MTSQVADMGDELARSFFEEEDVAVAKGNGVVFDENGKPVVYKRRWFILIAYCFGYFLWNLHSFRQTPLISEYALYFDRTNEVQPPPELGIDFMLVADNFYLLFFYPLGGKLIDTYGLQIMSAGAVLQAISTWWWFLSYQNYTSVLLSRVLASIGGAMIATALLRISNNWFAAPQRPLAVAIGAIFATFGGGAALLYGPFFSTGPGVVRLALKSCVSDFAGENTGDLEGLECGDDAREKFCCAAPTDIDLLNLSLAVFATVVALFTVVVTRDAPPTPPSKSGVVKKGPSFFKAMKLMFSHRNYSQICLTDFISSGPPLVLFATIDRIFPPSVQEFSTYSAAVGLVLSIPAAGFFAFYLAKTLKFYEMTAAGYVSGFVAWVIVTICVAIGTQGSDFVVLGVGAAALLCFVLWTVSVYELKMEYVFHPDYALQGYVVAVDRVIINLSSLIFVAAIPPERFIGERVSGRLFTFLVGGLFMMIGVILVLTIRNKRAYLRIEYEKQKETASEDSEDKSKNPESTKLEAEEGEAKKLAKQDISI